MRSAGTLRFDGMNGSERRRWAVCFGVCLAAHAAPVVVVAWWLGPVVGTAPAAPTAILVDMAPLPATPVPTQSEIPPGPVRQHIDAHEPKALRHEKMPPVLKAAVALPTAEEVRPNSRDKTPARETTAAPSIAAPLAPAAAAATTASDASSNAAPTWQGLVLGRLEQFKRYPTDALARNQEGVPRLRFTMDRDGHVLTFRIDKSSGYESLDSEVLALIQRAQPLPKPPPEVLGDRIQLVVPIEFYLRDRR